MQVPSALATLVPRGSVRGSSRRYATSASGTLADLCIAKSGGSFTWPTVLAVPLAVRVS